MTNDTDYPSIAQLRETLSDAIERLRNAFERTD
jgi:hypothetical protein